jgi:putative SOS response-associated peptidase YedK
MCGRFTLKTPANVLIEHFRLEGVPTDELPLFTPRSNISPTQEIAALRAGSGPHGRELTMMRWGLIPSWADDPKIGSRMINARGETVAEKPSFRKAFRARRCLIPADGFYEWKKEGSKKQPYRVHRPDEGPFAFAGLWERWKPKGEDTAAIESCTIITTEASEHLRELHERMPVIIAPRDYDLWLDAPVDEADRLQKLVRPFEEDELVISRADPPQGA